MKWWQKIILVISIVNILFLVGAYLSMYISPESFWPIAFVGLGYFPILVAYLFFMLLWCFLRRKVFFIMLLIFVAGFNTHRSYFAFGSFGNSIPDDKKAYKILQYNTQGFDAYNKDGKFLHRDEIINNIAIEQPDIVCLQEFNTYHDHPTEKSNLDMVVQATGLKHQYYFKAYENSKSTRSFGLIILSRFPIINSGHLEYLSLSRLNSTIFADIKIEKDTIRVFSSHLQSTQLSHYDLDFIESSNGAQTDFDADRVKNKLKTSYALRAQEADSIAINQEKSPFPIISCGDFNDTPVSYTYRKISQNLQDAFLQKGFGIGATYAPFPFIRIDYQLFDRDKFDIVDFKRIKEGSSDHYPCVTTFVLND